MNSGAQKRSEERAASQPAAPGRAPDENEMAALFASPAATFAAMTAFGFGMATQMANAFLHSLQPQARDPGNAAAPAEVYGEKQPAPVAPERATPAGPAAERFAAEAPAGEHSVPAVAKAAVPAKAARPKRATKTVASAAEVSVREPVTRTAAGRALGRTRHAEPRDGKRTRAAAASKGAKRVAADDLKRISGIGPKLEQLLHARGVTRFADIAGWSAEDIARFDAELGFDGRIARDDWAGQARTLMGDRN